MPSSTTSAAAGPTKSDQAARAPRELVRDIDQDHADHAAGQCIEPVIASPHGESETEARGDEASEGRAVFVEHRPKCRVAELPQEPTDGYAFFARCVPDLAHGDAEREGLEDHRESEHCEADRGRPDLVGMREAVIGLVHREDSAAEEQEERDGEGPEVALLPVAERVPRRRGPHAPADADVEKDLVQRVGDRVRGLRNERA